MDPLRFTKGKVALLDMFLSQARGSKGVMQGVPHAQGYGGNRR